MTSGKKQKISLWSSREEPIGHFLARVRKSRGLTLTQLAGRLGTTISNLSRMERERDLRFSSLLNIARELRLEPLLIPKEYVPAVRSLVDALASGEDHEVIRQRPRFAQGDAGLT